ncbi:hypothetical protein CONPUDRAFT_73223 [Coniophora puteana RWD-64-598 SS2]|uniref:Uncharacterized protein n=1 Tax=Coniophora puteana (strain RWD-64-598) TaxID=741705 RepID=A0A5M3MQR5_CONPW|nr:uncharacterized protein CONPUDRAFT_73223 [Coniophora puteana RWD-64-598 SS2]EIW81513.1 hypothetical protein CONPUDRAFT_73223 [Coniophora puteana RWD-64-598 SS2]
MPDQQEFTFRFPTYPHNEQLHVEGQDYQGYARYPGEFTDMMASIQLPATHSYAMAPHQRFQAAEAFQFSDFSQSSGLLDDELPPLPPVVPDNTLPPLPPVVPVAVAENASDASAHARDAAMAACNWQLSQESGDEEPSTDPLAPPSRATWAERNPMNPVIKTRARRTPLTPAQKEAREVARLQKEIRDAALAADVKAMLPTKDDIKRCAAKHEVDIKKVEELLAVRLNAKQKREKQLYNAIMHHEKIRLDNTGDKSTGQERLEKLHAIIKTKSYTRDEKDFMLNSLEQYRQEKDNSVRCSNHAANMHVHNTGRQMAELADGAAKRAGVYVAVMIVRGHINDTIQPFFYATDNSEEFFEGALGFSSDEVLHKFEQWGCNQSANLVERAQAADTLGNVRKECTEAIQEGLRSITHSGARMYYDSYEEKVVQGYRARLVGWPAGVPFVRPSKIGTVGAIRRLRDALDSEECRWETLDGKRAPKRRRILGPSRAANKAKASKAAPRKKTSASGTRRAPISPETIEDSDRE